MRNSSRNNACPVIEEEKQVGRDVSPESLYQVILYNDDVNEFVYVIHSLIQVCVPSVQLATKICMEAHETGRAICYVDSKDKCLQIKRQLETFGLTCSVEPI